jgi:molecular chaperone DnaJ
MSAGNYYRLLGVSPTATLVEIRRRYRALARECHPDWHPDDPWAAARFRRLAEAYEAIQAARAKGRSAARQYREPRFSGKERVLREFLGLARASRLERSPGADFRYDLQISLVAAMRGWDTVIQVDRAAPCQPCRGTGLTPGGRYQSCPQCQGRGRRFGGPGLLRFGPICEACQGRGKIAAHPCRHCAGRGQRPERRRYRLHIPPGTEDGARLRFPGEGGEGFHQGPPGNLEVVIHVEPHEFFTRVRRDLYCRVQVSFALAALGGWIRIPTLDGDRDFRLPRGTQNGRVFRLPGGGTPGGADHPPGDQFLEVMVTTPDYLTPRQEELLREVARLEAGPPGSSP